jgi:C1A family cysteine protease
MNSEAVYEKHFLNYVTKFNKLYAKQDLLPKYRQFRSNLDFIHTHNNNVNNTYKLGVNQFADLSLVEFQALQLSGGLKNFQTASDTKILKNSLGASQVKAADAVDWREKGAVGPIKNQGNCGACWAFSTTGAVEGAVAVATGVLHDLSEQQLMDCSSAYGNMACNGGLMTNAFQYLISKQSDENGEEKSIGLCAESAYPYKQKDGKKCNFSTCKQVAQINGFQEVEVGSEDSLLQAASLGPVSIAIEATSLGFMLYESGVFDDKGCGENLDHGVLLVGYGTQQANSTAAATTADEAGVSKDFWIVKNSWGTGWGEQGYIRMARGKNMCGVAKMASYAIVSPK